MESRFSKKDSSSDTTSKQVEKTQPCHPSQKNDCKFSNPGIQYGDQSLKPLNGARRINTPSTASNQNKSNSEKFLLKNPFSNLLESEDESDCEKTKKKPKTKKKYNKIKLHEQAEFQEIFEDFAEGYRKKIRSKSASKLAILLNKLTKNKYDLKKGSARTMLEDYIKKKDAGKLSVQSTLKAKEMITGDMSMDHHEASSYEVLDNYQLLEPSSDEELDNYQQPIPFEEAEHSFPESTEVAINGVNQHEVDPSQRPEMLKDDNKSIKRPANDPRKDEVKRVKFDVSLMNEQSYQANDFNSTKVWNINRHDKRNPISGNIFSELKSFGTNCAQMASSIHQFLGTNPENKEALNMYNLVADLRDNGNNIHTNVEVQNELEQNANIIERIMNNGKLKVPYEMTLNSKLNSSLVVANVNGQYYTYTSYRIYTPTKAYYQCTLCPSANKAKGLMDKGIFYVDEAHPQGCKGPLNEKEYAALQLNRMMRKNTRGGDKPLDAHNNIFKEACKQKVDVLIPHYSSIRQTLQRHYDKSLPQSKPGAVDEAHKKLLQGSDWLLSEQKHFTAFSSHLALVAIANAKVLAVDGTYSTSPAGFSQTLYITGLNENENGAEWNTLFMAPMTDKLETTYKDIFILLKNEWKKRNILPTFERIHCDYEAAAMSGAAELGGKEKVFGCLFHYDQALLRYAKHVGLFTHYMSSEKSKPEFHIIRRWIRLLLALPMLPSENALFLWENILNKIPQPPESFKHDWPSESLRKVVAYISHFL